jgi:hypothetical protein
MLRLVCKELKAYIDERVPLHLLSATTTFLQKQLEHLQPEDTEIPKAACQQIAVMLETEKHALMYVFACSWFCLWP